MVRSFFCEQNILFGQFGEAKDPNHPSDCCSQTAGTGMDQFASFPVRALSK